MFGRNKNLIVNPQAPTLASYHQGPVLTNGALEFLYNKPVNWPLYTLWGSGIVVNNQLNVTQPEQLRSELALTVAPIYGPGVPAGYVALQKLLEESGANSGN